jgi:AraC family transcriptional regulator, ethanolamine operon transcriptional activator
MSRHLQSPMHPGALASRRRAVVEQAESYVREHLDTRVPMSRLCRVVGLSERGLRNAFHSVRGMSPTQYMRSVRLRDVRRALSASEGSRATVTGIATTYGFYELGRFAGAYRAAFGEVPSETLRSTGRQSSH